MDFQDRLLPDSEIVGPSVRNHRNELPPGISGALPPGISRRKNQAKSIKADQD